MLGEDPEATVTAGNASGQNDGAAACIVTHRDRADSSACGRSAGSSPGRSPGSPRRRWASGPCPPPAGARAGRPGLDQIDLIELNEAFASQVLAVLGEWGLRDGLERVNVNGSGISLGHPVGATGARILATLMHEMDRRQSRYGLETMCIGGGQGLAAVFERVAA